MKKILFLLSHSKTTKLTKDHCHTRNGNRNRITLRQVLLVSALTMLSMPVFGQTYVNNNGVVGNGIITRSDNVSGKRMHYVKNGPTSGYLLGPFTINGPSFDSYQFSGYNINDFTIFNDTVYFCGEDADGVGFYGWTCTTIFNFFYWRFHIYRIYNNTDVTTSNFSRIKVFRSGQDLNVLLIGNYISSGYPTKKSIFHVKNNSTCTLAWGEVEAFDDVEILDNYVVTVERKADRFPNYYGQYMRVLNKTSFSLYDNLFDFYYDWSQRTTTAPVQLQAVGDNRFVSVYPYDTAYYFNAYSVSSGNISLHKYYTVPTGIQPTIGDVAYNSYDKTLAILLNIDTVGTAMFYDCTSYPTITLTTSKYPKIGSVNPPYETRLLSLTNYSSSGFAITGFSGNKTVFWNTQGSSCGLVRQFSVSTAEDSVSSKSGATHRNTINVHHTSFQIHQWPYTVTPKCQTLMPPTPGVGK